MRQAKNPQVAGWTVGRARAQFAGLLKAAERAPQKIYSRKRLQAVVVHPAVLSEVSGTPASPVTKPRNLYEAFAGIRQIARETGWEFPKIERRDRPNDFFKAFPRRSR